MTKEKDGHQQVLYIKFTRALYWVHLHDLPFISRNEYMGRPIKNKIGCMEESDIKKGEMAQGEFMQV